VREARILTHFRGATGVVKYAGLDALEQKIIEAELAS
jgi:hypothetical protein